MRFSRLIGELSDALDKALCTLVDERLAQNSLWRNRLAGLSGKVAELSR